MTESGIFYDLRDGFTSREFIKFIRGRFKEILIAKDLCISEAKVRTAGRRSKPEAVTYHLECSLKTEEKIAVMGCWQKGFPISVTITFGDGKEMTFYEYAMGKERPDAIINAVLTKSLFSMIAIKSKQQK
jgi:hypothetical protein